LTNRGVRGVRRKGITGGQKNFGTEGINVKGRSDVGTRMGLAREKELSKETKTGVPGRVKKEMRKKMGPEERTLRLRS